MSIEGYLEEMTKIQTLIIDFVDYESNVEEKYQNIKDFFDYIKIYDNKYKIKSVLYLILRITNNHHRESDFFSKIDQILLLFTREMKKFFTNSELFNIFKRNKRLLLFLLENKIMIIDEYIAYKFFNKRKYIYEKYPQYFQPEIQPYISEKLAIVYYKRDKKYNYSYKTVNIYKLIEDIKKNVPDSFFEKRRIGENDDYICTLIQKDLIEEFIIYVNKNSISVNSTIDLSIYETNNFLLRDANITLIQYAVFFGSTQIFNYLRKNGAELYYSLWIYAVHSRCEEIIHFLEENKSLLTKKQGGIYDFDNKEPSYEQIYYESIKCHHIDVANYIQTNYLQNEKDYFNCSLMNCFKYYNFILLEFDIRNENLFYYLCKYDYYILALILYKKIDIDMNKKIINIVIFLISLLIPKY